jgi:hypothetical protein
MEFRSLFRKLPKKPGPGEGPEAIGGTAANAQGFGRFLMREAREVAKLHESSRVGVVTLELAQGFVQID